MKINNFFPIIDSLSTHSKQKWRKDLIAGVTVAVMLVPQGMAYAMLAGMPPIYGLYGGLIPLLLYALFGTSRQMSIGPVAISALLVLAGVSQLAEPFTAEYIHLAIITGLLVGVVQVLLSFLRLGFLVNFISHPVIIGFTSAAAIIIAISQLKDFLGMNIPRFSRPFETLQYAIQHLGEANVIAVVMCLLSILTMVVLKRVNRAIPGALLVVVVGALLVFGLSQDVTNVAVIGTVPEGLPSFLMPELSWANVKLLAPTVFTVSLICIVESIAIAKILQAKHGDYKIRPDQELFALGISKVGGAFFQSLPTSGSFTRSAVNNESGATSGFASIFTAIIIGLTLLFLTPLFYFVPKCVLAAIILLSVKSLFEWEEALSLWRMHRRDFFMMLTTFLVTLLFGIEEGVVAGVLLSISMILYKSSKPHMAVLGKLPNSRSYRNINRYESAEEVEGVLIVRFDDQLYFANAAYFLDEIQHLLDGQGDSIKVLLLDAKSMHSIDSAGIHALEETQRYLQQRNIAFCISGMMGPVRDTITKTGLLHKLGEKCFYLNIYQAVTHLDSLANEEDRGWLPDVLQSNEESN